jgi:hypothetical protein
VLVAFTAVSCWVLALNLWMSIHYGDVWTGTDGIAAQDPMQYLAWIRDASEHGLASNLYVLEPTRHDYIQPLVAVSAVLTALGVAPWAAMLLWKPAAIAGCYLAVRGFVWQTVEGRPVRVATLLVALFFTGWGGLTLHLLDSHSHGIQWTVITNEIWIPYSMWGYTFSAIAFASMVGALVAYAGNRDNRTVGWVAPALGALAAWLHPWQGQLLLVILLGSEAVLWRAKPLARWEGLLLTAGATALPLGYCVALRHWDVSWQQGSAAGHRIWPIWIVLLSLLPLALPALLAYRSRPQTFLGVVARVWPVAAIVVLLVDELLRADGEVHVLLGMSVPLAVLAATGLQSIAAREPALVAVTATALLVAVPPAYEEVRNARQTVRAVYRGTDANFITADERDALEWLAHAPGAGGVLTNPYLGTVVPARTGRATWVGNPFWSWDFYARAVAVNNLFEGLQPQAARHFVRSTGARFVLADCHSPVDLTPGLAPMLASRHTFGCARVYEVRDHGSTIGAAAHSRP